MTDRPPLPSQHSLDPFADDRARTTQFSEPERPYHGTHSTTGSGMRIPQPFESSTTVNEFGAPSRYDDDDDAAEKVPLNASDASFAGGFYPPAYVAYRF